MLILIQKFGLYVLYLGLLLDHHFVGVSDENYKIGRDLFIITSQPIAIRSQPKYKLIIM